MALATTTATTPAAGRAPRDPAFPALEREATLFGEVLHQQMQEYAKEFDKAMEGRLTLPQFMVLAAVKNHPGSNQTNAVAVTGIDRSTTADIARRLTKRGLLQRRRTKEDARAYAIKLTDTGAALLREATKIGQRIDRSLRPQIMSSLQQSKP